MARPGSTAPDPNQLNVPVFAIQLPNEDIMIVDQGNNRVIRGQLHHEADRLVIRADLW